jgi:two-component system sensor histidine kinase/response regulator
MTANTMTGDRELCLKAGMDDYIGKPIRPESLDGAIARLTTGSVLGSPSGAVDPMERPDPDVPVFEASLLSDACGDDDETRERLIELFLDQAANKVEELGSAVAAGDGAAVSELAHGLKGSSAAVGAMRLANASDRLCETGRADQLGDGGVLQEGLERDWESTRAALGARDRAKPGT